MYETLLKTINEKGISRNKLAIMSGIAAADIYGLFREHRPLFPSWKIRICDALEKTEEELFPKDEIMESPTNVVKSKVKPRMSKMAELEERVAMLEAKVEKLERRIK